MYVSMYVFMYHVWGDKYKLDLIYLLVFLLCCLPVKEWQVCFTVLKTILHTFMKFKDCRHTQLALFLL